MRRALLIGCLASLFSCHPGDSVPFDAGRDADATDGDGAPIIPPGGIEACAAYHTLLCSKWAECAPDTFTRTFPSQADCVTRATAACQRRFDDPGTPLTPSKLSACTASLSSLDCRTYLRMTGENSPAPTPACDAITRGSLDEGADNPFASPSSCASGAQCATGYCDHSGGLVCGTCILRPRENQACLASRPFACALGTLCIAGVCTKYVEEGSDCSDTKPCHVDLRCKSGKCTARAKDGEPCEPTTRDGGCVLGLFCNVASSKCESIALKAKDAPCGLDDKGALLGCALGLACDITDDTKLTGTCVPRIDPLSCGPTATDAGVADTGDADAEAGDASVAFDAGGVCNLACSFDGPLESQCAYPWSCINGTCTLRDGNACK